MILSTVVVHKLVSEPYPNQTLKTKFSKTAQQKLKVNMNSYRVSLVLSEHTVTFKFYWEDFEKLVFKVWLEYGSVRYEYKFGETAVRTWLIYAEYMHEKNKNFNLFSCHAYTPHISQVYAYNRFKFLLLINQNNKIEQNFK